MYKIQLHQEIVWSPIITRWNAERTLLILCHLTKILKHQKQIHDLLNTFLYTKNITAPNTTFSSSECCYTYLENIFDSSLPVLSTKYKQGRLPSLFMMDDPGQSILFLKFILFFVSILYKMMPIGNNGLIVSIFFSLFLFLPFTQGQGGWQFRGSSTRIMSALYYVILLASHQ